MRPRTWYRVQMLAEDPSIAELYIIDIIGDWIDDYLGFGVTAKAFIEDLSKLPEAVKTIRVHINSPGGDVFSALNIANALRDQRTSKGRAVEMIVDGLAASSASMVLMAGSPIRIADNALVMVHNPWSVAIGNAAELRKSADVLDALRDTIVATYKWQSSLTEDELVALMDAETWMDADEAIANGFATEKIEGLKAAASLDPRGVARLSVPEKYRARVDALVTKPAPSPAEPQPAAAGDVLRLCREGECLDLAEGLIAESATLEGVQARVTQARQARADAAGRATAIRTLCDRAKLPELANGYIQGEMSLEAVRAQLTVLTAKLDRIEIDGSLPADQGRPRPRINTNEVYAKLNQG